MRNLTISIVIGSLMLTLPLLAQNKSEKRGVGWDEKTQVMTAAPLTKLAPGVSWIYNWGTTPKNEVSNLGPNKDIEFVPMCWNGNFDESALRTYLTNHSGVKYLLGFNEPNFSAQSNMTPTAAAAIWPKLEKIAADFNVKLVAPALNFSGETVGGRTWSPYEWLDAFIAAYPTAKFDYLALHSYMNWYSATLWFAAEYFYKDLYNSSKTDVYGKYPNIVKYLDSYKENNGLFPQMFLTEFCSWEGNKDGYTSSVDSQIDQMTQKLQKMEQNDLVAGYAWFMANTSQAPTVYPYNSLFMNNTSSAELSEQGKVYVYMSAFDTSKYYDSGETIMAKDYIDASTDNQIAKVRSNTESGSDIPLQVLYSTNAWTSYQINVPTTGEYTITLHTLSQGDITAWFYIDSKNINKSTLSSTNGVWSDRSVTVSLNEGKHTLMLFNAGSQQINVSSLKFAVTTGIKSVEQTSNVKKRYFSVQGTEISKPEKGLCIIQNVNDNGTTNTIKTYIY